VLVNVFWVNNKLPLFGSSFSKLMVKCMLARKPKLACESARTLCRLFILIRLCEFKLNFELSKFLITYPTLEEYKLRF
jgi:hypothetical protein